MSGQPAPGSNPWLCMDCTSLSVAEPGLPPVLIINQNQPFELSTDFNFSGTMALGLIWLMAGVPGNDFNVEYFYEGIGAAAPEGSFGVVPLVATAGVLNYGAPNTTLTVPANTVPAGTYKLTCVVTMQAPLFGWLTGFYEGDIIQIF